MRRMIGISLAVFMLSACSELTTTTNTLPGTYALRSMNGSPLPYSVQLQNDVSRRYTGGQLLLRDNASWRMVLDYTDSQASSSTPGQQVNEGTYERTNALNFILEQGSLLPWQGYQADRSTVRVSNHSATWEYEFRR